MPVFEIFRNNTLKQVNVEGTVEGSKIVGVWPVADRNHFIPNPFYVSSSRSVFSYVQLPKGTYEIKDAHD